MVSAMSGVTNYLIACIRDRPETPSVLDYLRDKYSSAAQGMLSEERFERCSQQLDASLSILRGRLEARWSVESDPVLEDAIFCWGERLSTIMLTNILEEKGIRPSPSLEDAGMVPRAALPTGRRISGHPCQSISHRASLLDKASRDHHWLLRLGRTGRLITFGRGSRLFQPVIAYGIDADC